MTGRGGNDDEAPLSPRGGLSSVVCGLLGLTGAVVPSIVAIVVGRRARAFYHDDPSAFRHDLGRGGELLGYLGLGLALVALAVWLFRLVM